MRIIVTDSYEEMSKVAARIVAGQLYLKPNSVLGLATGSTPEGILAPARRGRGAAAGILCGHAADIRPAARPARHRVSAAGLGGAARHPLRRDAHVWRARRRHRQPECQPRRRHGQPPQPDPDRHPLPPRHRRERHTHRLYRRAGDQAKAAGARGDHHFKISDIWKNDRRQDSLLRPASSPVFYLCRFFLHKRHRTSLARIPNERFSTYKKPVHSTSSIHL